jgi:hypothetical protein
MPGTLPILVQCEILVLNSPCAEYSVLMNFYSPGKKLRLLETLYASGNPFLTVSIFFVHTAMWGLNSMVVKKITPSHS